MALSLITRQLTRRGPSTALPAALRRVKPAPLVSLIVHPRGLHGTTKQEDEAVVGGQSAMERVAARAEAEGVREDKAPGVMYGRITTTFEIMVSKLFPAGFGWQAASVVAGNAGLEDTMPSFWLATGLGDFVGVIIGHSGYKILESTMNKNVDVGNEIQTGLWLATAAFFSGTAWQPAVNMCGALQYDFFPAAVQTGIICGTAFYTGLRLGRKFLPLPAIAGPSYSNLQFDAQLSYAIGGATAMFVATDPGLAGNPFADIFGVQDTDSDLMGCFRAGSSTFAGFGLLNTTTFMNPAQKMWLDPGAFEHDPESIVPASIKREKTKITRHATFVGDSA